MSTKLLNVLLVGENKADKIIAEEILMEAELQFILNHVISLKEAISYLSKEKEYLKEAKKTDLIILEAGLLYRNLELWKKNHHSVEGFKEIPSIALILFKEEETFFRSHSLPVGFYLVKPLDFTELDEVIIKDLKDFVGNIVLTDGY